MHLHILAFAALALSSMQCMRVGMSLVCEATHCVAVTAMTPSMMLFKGWAACSLQHGTNQESQ